MTLGHYYFLWQVIDAIDNWVTLTQCVRWYSHEAQCTRRALSDFRWMAGVSASEKEQVGWCEEVVNKVLSRNKHRAVSVIDQTTGGYSSSVGELFTLCDLSLLQRYIMKGSAILLA